MPLWLKILILICHYTGSIKWDAYQDYLKEKMGIWVKHGPEAAVLSLFIAITTWMIMGNPDHTAAAFIMYWPFRWLAFDATLNLLRGKPFDYLGKGEKAAMLDRLLGKCPRMQYYIKGLVFLVCAGLAWCVVKYGVVSWLVSKLLLLLH